MRSEILGRDSINLTKYVIIQLQSQIQWDGSSCGIYCLKVKLASYRFPFEFAMCMYTIAIYIYVFYIYIKQMAEQILGFGRLDERNLATLNIVTARRDIATTLISNSG